MTETTRSTTNERSNGATLRIAVRATVGEGLTELSAFDDALLRCGVHNYNIIPLSSVIPPGTEVVDAAVDPAPDHEFGHRLYVVKAEARSSEPDSVVAAGIGWYQWDDGRGVFVEHEDMVPLGSIEHVRTHISNQITTTLHDLVERRGAHWNPAGVGSVIAATRIQQQPACALALAIYQSQGWQKT
jgi:arginine decarboxylase